MTDKEKFSEEEALEKVFGDLIADTEKGGPKKTPGPATDAAQKEIKPVTRGVPKDKLVTIKESEYQKLLKDIADSKDRYLRLFAEFENVRKRTEREKAEFVKYANEGLVAEFLAIVDDLERSVDAAKAKHEDYDAFLKGIEMVMAHVHEMLKKNNVQPVEAKGKMFDPHLHEALMQEETDQYKEGTIVEELQKGYTLDGKVIRTARVKVATAKTAKDAKQKESTS